MDRPKFHIIEDGDAVEPLNGPRWRVAEGLDVHRPGVGEALRRLVDHVLFDLADDDEDDADELGADGLRAEGYMSEERQMRSNGGEFIDRSERCWRCRAFVFREDEEGQRRCGVCAAPFPKPGRVRRSRKAA